MAGPYVALEDLTPALNPASGAYIPLDAFASTVRGLRAGYSMAEAYIGDSTGANADDFFTRRAAWFADAFPQCNVRYQLWDGTAQRLKPAVSVQSGTGQRGGVAGDEHIHFDFTDAATRGRRLPKAEISWSSPDLDIAVELSLDSWVTGAEQTIVSNFAAVPDRGITLKIGSTGRIKVDGTTEGTTTFTAQTANSVPFTAGQRGAIRAKVVAGGLMSAFTAPSIDGPWTQLGSSVASPATIFKSVSADWYLASRGGDITEKASGNIYTVEIRNGIDGPVVNPQPIDTWHKTNSTDVSALRGSPTLRMLNGSQAGSVSQDYGSVRLSHAIQLYGARQHVLVNFGHNQIFESGGTYLGSIDSLLTALTARSPYSPVTLVRQNPSKAPWTGYQEEGPIRGIETLGYAMHKGLGLVDVYEAFRQFGDFSGLLDADGPHPTSETRGGTIPYGAEVAALVLWARTKFWL